MAKEWTIDELYELALKFGAAPKEWTRKEQFIANGWTEEEFGALPLCPREGDVTSKSSWPRIGGRRTYPLSGVLTPEEKAAYNNYAAGYRNIGSNARMGITGKAPDEETQKLIALVRAELCEKGASAEAIAAFERLVPGRKISLIREFFGVDDIWQFAEGGYTMAYLMFRGPSGEFADSPRPDMVTLCSAGFMPAHTVQQVRDMVAKLEEKGILVKGAIVDFPA